MSAFALRFLPTRALITLAVFLIGSTADASTFQVLHTFCGPGISCLQLGQYPDGLIRDGAGNLYGITEYEDDSGGASNGNIYELKKSSLGVYAYHDLYDFCPNNISCTNGTHPQGQLIIDQNGNLYGVTKFGGTQNKGTVFKLTKPTGSGSWSITTLWSFCGNLDGCPEGINPVDGLTFAGAASGAIYDGTSALFGTTSGSTSGQNYGTVFKLTSVAGTPAISTLYTFCTVSGCPDGSVPNAIIADSYGNLYGTTRTGGIASDVCHATYPGCGVVFELSPNGSGYSETTLYKFCPTGSSNCTDAIFPVSPLIIDGQGNLLGVTPLGGPNLNCTYELSGVIIASSCGTVFKIVPNGANSAESILYNFCDSDPTCGDGGHAFGRLWIDANGVLYGTTKNGGAYNFGTLFSLSGSTETVLHSFCNPNDCSDSAQPYSGVVGDSSGNLFGTDFQYPLHPGVVFEWSP